ncbi:LURP-one-related/scramblase family protein [Halopenitus sp. H-Gu1]|uniref:LURP-one-related/scramblase family protein n=1 Tax=Halopenitus sp. H-Gu1 TaxID=3242697 RepID=UPI00359ECF3B
MTPEKTYEITGLELSDTNYTVEQSLIGNRYEALDASGNTVLKGKQKLFKSKEEFPFSDSDGNDVFTVKASSVIDVAGDYLLTDSQTGTDLVILDNDFSVFQDTWKIRDADDRSVLAEITSRGALVALARRYVPFGEWIPHKYEITDQEGTHVGSIEGQLSLKDRYDITIDDASSVPKEPIVAAAMVIDAIQGH